ncbi:hypothetical protein D9M68_849110 [compost metagenome]
MREQRMGGAHGRDQRDRAIRIDGARHVLDEVDIAQVVDPQRGLQGLVGAVGDAAEHRQTGGVDRDIQPAMQAQRGVRQFAHLCLIASVAGQRVAADPVREPLQRRQAARRHQHPSPGRRQRLGDGPACTALGRRTEYDRNLVLQWFHLSNPLLVVGRRPAPA